MKKRRKMSSSQIAATAIGLIIVATFVISLVAPGTSNSNTTVPTALPNDSDTSSNQSAPVSAILGIEGKPPLLSGSGLFQAFQPASTRWYVYQDNYAPNENRANLIFRGQCAIIHNFVQLGFNYDTPEELSEAVFNDDYFTTEWLSYPEWELTSRTFDAPYVIMDFDLVGRPEGNCPTDYVGRQISWMENGLLYNVRLVVMKTDKSSLDKLQALTVPSFTTYAYNADIISQQGWRSRSNLDEGYFIVIPSYFLIDTVADYVGTAQMASYQINIETSADTPLASAEEAQAWLMNYRSGITILDNETVEQPFATGYRFSFSFENSDGDSFSGAASLLNDADGKLYVAEIFTSEDDLNFLVENTENANLTSARKMLNSFSVMYTEDTEATDN